MDSSQVFEIRRPAMRKIPLVISTPHVGTDLPEEIRRKLNPELARALPDTDWYVDQLYDFWDEIGAVLIRPRYSRYVVDLNRPTSGPQLYTDSRRQTEVIPTTSFGGVPLYEERDMPDVSERDQRIARYHLPYYQALAALIAESKAAFGKALLFDAHSIARFVPSIRPHPFPDMIVGDRDGQTTVPAVSGALRKELQDAGFDVSYNEPFKGGEITRYHGRPQEAVHAIQLEMSQDVYLSDGALDAKKLAHLQLVLKRALISMAAAI